jgi:hypothetical protein
MPEIPATGKPEGRGLWFKMAQENSVSSYMEKKAIRALSVSQRVKCLLIRTGP